MRAVQIHARAPLLKTTKYIKLKGVDMSADPSQIGEGFSPWCPNLISDNGGNPEKRPGWRVVYTIEGPVNGLWHGRIGSDRYYFAHGGTKLYAWRPEAPAASVGNEGTAGSPPGNTPVVIRSGLSNSRGCGFIMNERFWLLTGREYVVYGLFSGNSMSGDSEKKDDIPPVDEDKPDVPGLKLTCRDVSDIAYVPTVIIARAPTGGGTPYESINLLGKRQKNRFLTTTATAYQLSATKIKSVDEVVLNGAVKTANADYTVDLDKGTVTFKTAPPAPPVTGKDNLVITFTKEYAGYADRIQKCTIAVGYGYGTNDRIFFAGNPDKRNMDWFSGLGDPSYVPDLNYSKVGSEETAIMGYHRLGEYLAVIKEDNQQDSTIFLRSAQVNNGGEVVFPIRQGIAGVGAVSPWAFAVLKDEPLFLSRTGIYAITSNVVTAERTVRGRSYFIDAQLTKEPDLKRALAVEWNGYYVLAAGGRAYILDGNSTKENTRQYSSDYAYRAYHWDNIPATALMEDAGVLWFGSQNGRVCRFNTDLIKMERFADDDLENPSLRHPIVAQWATKADDDGDFMLRKTLSKKGSGVLIRPYTRSSVRVLVRSDQDCLAKFGRYSTMDIWDWEDIDFSRIGFTSNDAPQVAPFHTKVKKYITLQIIVENNAINEGFGVYGIIKRYTVGNYVK